MTGAFARLGAGLAAFLVDALVFGHFGLGGLFLMAWLAFLIGSIARKCEQELFEARVRQAAAVLGGIVAIFIFNAFGEHLSKRRAAALAQACYEFQGKNGRFPEKLEELVPGTIPKIPAARLASIGANFRYHAGATHTLEWVSLTARHYLVLEEGRWAIVD